MPPPCGLSLSALAVLVLVRQALLEGIMALENKMRQEALTTGRSAASRRYVDDDDDDYYAYCYCDCDCDCY